MLIREENCNMVLLAGITLLSLAVAGAASWLEPASASGRETPARTAALVAPLPVQPVAPADPSPVRVIGTPFVPNTNPRQR